MQSTGGKLSLIKNRQAQQRGARAIKWQQSDSRATAIKITSSVTLDAPH